MGGYDLLLANLGEMLLQRCHKPGIVNYLEGCQLLVLFLEWLVKLHRGNLVANIFTSMSYPPYVSNISQASLSITVGYNPIRNHALRDPMPSGGIYPRGNSSH